MDEGSTERKLP